MGKCQGFPSLFQPFNHAHKVAKFCYADKVSVPVPLLFGLLRGGHFGDSAVTTGPQPAASIADAAPLQVSQAEVAFWSHKAHGFSKRGSGGFWLSKPLGPWNKVV